MNDGLNKRPLGDDELESVVGGSLAINGARIASMGDVGSMDIESALMLVQSERTALLDSALQSQIAEVQQRNQVIGELNTGLSGLNDLLGRLEADEPISQEEANRLASDLDSLLAKFNVDGIDNDDNGVIAEQEVKDVISAVKQLADQAGNSQQMDMLRLQSLSNKRNEAFEIMSNFMKKMQDTRSSIIGNMR